MILWENTINPKLKGKAKSDAHFQRLNALANGNLKRVEKVSKEAKKVAKKVAEDAQKSAE